MEIDEYILALHRFYLNKPRAALETLRKFGDAETAFRHDRQLRYSDDLKRDVAKDIAWLNQPDCYLLKREAFPDNLLSIFDPPNLLFAKGLPGVLKTPAHRVAIVGARKASNYGRQQATNIAERLSRSGITVVSGLAMGIDAASHEGALLGPGPTIAVLGTGCDQIYPRRNWRLAERICSAGLILSEYPPGTRAFPSHFPRRNRIVTGLCEATVVIEAAQKSGSLISARLAASEGREVMALPGLVTNAGAKGCHQLIRDGATLIESGADIQRELGLEGTPGLQLAGEDMLLRPELRQLLACVEREPQTIDTLMTRVELSIEELTVSLISLEVQGLITSDGGYYLATGRYDLS
jgi:DNA processing protein